MTTYNSFVPVQNGHELSVWTHGVEFLEQSVLVIPGGPGVAGAGVALSEKTMAGHVYYDHRAIGNSTFPASKRFEDLSTATLAGDAVDVAHAVIPKHHRVIAHAGSFGASVMAVVMAEHPELTADGAIILRSPWFSGQEEGNRQISSPEVVAKSGVRLAELRKFVPEDSWGSSSSFMQAVREQMIKAKEEGDFITVAKIALAYSGRQLKLGEATNPSGLSANIMKGIVNFDRLFTSERPDLVVKMMKRVMGVDAVAGAEIALEFYGAGSENYCLFGEGYKDGWDYIRENREHIREAIEVTATGKLVILSGTDDVLTPKASGAKFFQDTIGKDRVVIVDVRNAGHPAKDQEMAKAVKATIAEASRKISAKS